MLSFMCASLFPARFCLLSSNEHEIESSARFSLSKENNIELNVRTMREVAMFSKQNTTQTKTLLINLF